MARWCFIAIGVGFVAAVALALGLFFTNTWKDSGLPDEFTSTPSTPLTTTEENKNLYSFSNDFKFGASSASYQIEGGWNEDGKTPSIWDTVAHDRPGFIVDNSTGDVAADSYHMYDKDIEALSNIGFEMYRFSISWSRILPDGGKVNMKGIEYYNKLIDGLIEKDIEPLVTMFHWDLPQYLQDIGGWTNPNIVVYFKDYSDILYQHFGDRVKNWITFNEASVFCGGGYGDGYHAPGLHSPGVGDYLCAHHVLLSHAAAYHLYKDTYFTEQQGKIGIVVNTGYNYRGDDTVAPEVAERAQEFESGRFANPIFSKEGGYPKVVIDQVNMKSEREGRPWSRLPSMTPAEQAWIQGTADFMALNYYTSSKVWPRPDDPNDTPSIWSDTNVWGFKDDSWKKSASEWLVNCPQGLQDILVYIKNKYDNPVIMITENGWSDLPGVIQDDERVQYVKAHLAAISRAIKESDCKVVAYTVWSLTDNFEWARGYTERFGIHYIDFDSAEKTRVPKASAIWFKEFMKTRKFEYEVEGVWG